MSEELLTWAKFYVFSRGWSIIPVVYGSKRAAIKWSEFQNRLPTEVEIDSWFSNGASLNIGVVCGPVSSIVCIDKDAWRSDFDASFLSVIPDDIQTPTVRSPRGLHHYFSTPEDDQVRSIVICPGVELRAARCMVVAPPSIIEQENGPKAYIWDPGRRPDEIPMLSLPVQDIRAYIAKRRSGRLRSILPVGRGRDIREGVGKERIRFASYEAKRSEEKRREEAIRFASSEANASSEAKRSEEKREYATLVERTSTGCSLYSLEEKDSRFSSSEAIASSEEKSVAIRSDTREANASLVSLEEAAFSDANASEKFFAKENTLPPIFYSSPPLQRCYARESTITLKNDPDRRGIMAFYSIQGFKPGSRDMDCWRLAYLLMRGGATESEIRTTLDAVMSQHLGHPDHEGVIYTKDRHDRLIESKIKSAAVYFERTMLSEELRKLILKEEKLKLNEIYTILGVSKPASKALVREILSKMPDVRSTGKGYYELLKSNLEYVDPWSIKDCTPLDIEFPLALEERCLLYPGNIMLVQGNKGAGKTAFLLNVLAMNKDKWKNCFYFNSEAGDAELANRVKKVSGVKQGWEKVKFIQWFDPTRSFEQVLREHKGSLFVIDFLEIYSEFWKIGEKILDIHRGLDGNGLCVVAVQKSKGADAPRGGYFAWEKPRLIIDLDRQGRDSFLTIRDCKAWKEENPNGVRIRFRIVDGWKFIYLGETDEI